MHIKPAPHKAETKPKVSTLPRKSGWSRSVIDTEGKLFLRESAIADSTRADLPRIFGPVGMFFAQIGYLTTYCTMSRAARISSLALLPRSTKASLAAEQIPLPLTIILSNFRSPPPHLHLQARVPAKSQVRKSAANILAGWAPALLVALAGLHILRCIIFFCPTAAKTGDCRRYAGLERPQ